MVAPLIILIQPLKLIEPPTQNRSPINEGVVGEGVKSGNVSILTPPKRYTIIFDPPPKTINDKIWPPITLNDSKMTPNYGKR